MSDVNKLDDCMLSFDLKIGTRQFSDSDGQYWGCLVTSVFTFGTLTNLQSTIDIKSILAFVLVEAPIDAFNLIQFQFDIQNQLGLASKNLEVTVGGFTYYLGSAYASGASGHDPKTYFNYNSDGAKQLGDLLKQNVGNTLSFCFNWK
ncbi:hypothetical protein Xsto_03780 [Xenorhabdus stockiae]|uniref:DUF7823 domain-containing protein n=1 Tax=Xenorhabdus stockiae TaxID=351614 RepID=A0A2D0KB23_9GAMM|nr:hypothetical protein [Xenorhabdus stockiae]PHM60669.1 hypothetical protein Xsto_03780 [Xenorhabdus stockiae]